MSALGRLLARAGQRQRSVRPASPPQRCLRPCRTTCRTEKLVRERIENRARSLTSSKPAIQTIRFHVRMLGRQKTTSWSLLRLSVALLGYVGYKFFGKPLPP